MVRSTRSGDNAIEKTVYSTQDSQRKEYISHHREPPRESLGSVMRQRGRGELRASLYCGFYEKEWARPGKPI